MKLYKFFSLVIFCFFTLAGLSQEIPGKTFAVLISPALLRAPETQWGLQTGVAYSRKKWSVGIEAALPFRKSYLDYAKIKYMRLGLEFKSYGYNVSPAKIYVSLQTNYAVRQMLDTNGNVFLSKNPRGVFSFSKASVSSPVFSSSIKVGIEVQVYKNLFLDVFSGTGVRIISTSYKNVENTSPSFFNEAKEWFDFTPVYRYEDTFTKLHLKPGLGSVM